MEGNVHPRRGGLNHRASKDFYRGGLPGLSRALKAGISDAAVCVEQTSNNDMAKIYRIRKLTPKECFRLMGVSDSDFDKIQAYPFHELLNYPSYSREEKLKGMTEKEKRALMKDKISESQQYKLAGNSIVVDVMTELYDNLFFGSEPQEGENYMQLFYD